MPYDTFWKIYQKRQQPWIPDSCQPPSSCVVPISQFIEAIIQSNFKS